jgi:hypothetical protein
MKGVSMTELAFLIFAIVGLITTAKLWKPWVQHKADELDIVIKDQSVDLQDDLHDLAEKIEATKEKHKGTWYTTDTIDAMMK